MNGIVEHAEGATEDTTVFEFGNLLSIRSANTGPGNEEEDMLFVPSGDCVSSDVFGVEDIDPETPVEETVARVSLPAFRD